MRMLIWHLREYTRNKESTTVLLLRFATLKYHTEDNLFPKSALYRFRAAELGGGYGGNEEDYNIAYQLAVKEVTDILHKRARMKRSLRWLYGRKSDDETLDRFDAYCQDYRLILKHDETDEQAMISLLNELII